MMKKRFILYTTLLTITGGIIGYSFQTVSTNDFEISKNMEIFGAVYKEVNSFYVDDIQPGTFMKEGIDAMLESLDPYTVYIPESDIEDYRFMTTGQYGGIGALIRNDGKYSIITDAYEGFPAQKAGLIPGDIILSIDDKSIEGKTTDEVSKFLKGQAGTSVKVKIRREGVGEFEKTLTREEIKIKEVPYYGMLDDKTGYIRLTSFTQTASAEVKKAFKDLKDTKGMKQLVFDLRGNGGGLLLEAVNIVNIFVPKGQSVVSQKGRIPGSNINYKASLEAMDTEIPLVVLVDEGSASASEIVSGSIQDLDRGVIIGRRSYGKGLVQQTKSLPYNSMVKLTVAKYYTPSGRCIQKLDYAHKDEAGKATVFADSLLKKFKTKNGRDVFDGRGIDPDIRIEEPELSKILIALYTENLIFNYATKFKREHESIPDPKDFKLTDSEYQDFLKYLSDKEFSYTTASEKKFEELKSTAEKEKYFSESKSEFEALIAKLKPNKQEDLMRFKDEIIRFLESEIVSRYYFQTGRSIYSLKNDPYIESAIKVLNDKAEYKSILSGPAKK